MNLESNNYYQDILQNFVISRYQHEFEPIEQIGEGGFGSVFKVKNKLDSHLYAVKIIHAPNFTPNKWFDLLQEVRTMACLSHPNVLSYFSVWVEIDFAADVASSHPPPSPGYSSSGDETVIFESDDSVADCLDGKTGLRPSHQLDLRPLSLSDIKLNQKAVNGIIKSPANLFIQMELCATDLRRYLQQRRPTLGSNKFVVVDLNFNKSTVDQLFQALLYLHEDRGIVHKDICPENIFFRSSDFTELVLGDFGLSQYLDEGNAKPKLGHRLYTSGEQWRGCKTSKQSDVFSLGMILFELFYPFQTEMERTAILNDLRTKQTMPTGFEVRFANLSALVRNMICDDQRFDIVQTIEAFHEC